MFLAYEYPENWMFQNLIFHKVKKEKIILFVEFLL